VEVKEWIMVVTVILVITGWFINSHLNRKHELFKKKLDLRLQMFNSYISAAVILEKLRQTDNGGVKMPESEEQKLVSKFIDKLEKSHLQILLYGSSAEIQSINKIVSLAQENNRFELLNKSAEFMSLIREDLREQLGINNI